MATPSTVTDAASAAAAAWNLQGSGSNWFAEKPVQGGKFLAVGATSAACLTAIQSVEDTHGKFKSGNSPKDTNWKGYVV